MYIEKKRVDWESMGVLCSVMGQPLGHPILCIMYQGIS